MSDQPDTEAATRLGLFEGYGIELEYMLVDADTLAVRPLTDELMRVATGEYASDFEDGAISWSNELALHVVELKTTAPSATLSGLAPEFARSLGRLSSLLEPMNVRLLPTGMHPFMDPFQELRLWPHDNDVVYRTFDRIFDCRGHGWANLQSMHINFAFGEDTRADGEFARLHAAIRAVLALLPALSASSPIVDGQVTGTLDTRLAVYRNNAQRVPQVSGSVIPEVASTRAQYQQRILEPIYEAMAPFDPEGTVRHEWCNARGAIARFDRNAIEIRVLDVQECPDADLGIARLVDSTVRALVAERWTSLEEQNALAGDVLVAQLTRCIEHAEAARVTDASLLATFGLDARPRSAAEVWQHLQSTLLPSGEGLFALRHLLEHGSLARRIVQATGQSPSRAELVGVYRELAACLSTNQPFDPRAR